MLLQIVLLVTLNLCISFTSYAATYYVEPKGSAANDIADSGASAWSAATSISSPVSLGTALVRAVAGDIVQCRGGTYTTTNSGDYEIPAFNPSNSGTESQPITFICYSGETCVVTPTTSGGAALGAGGVDYIIWDRWTGTLDAFTSDVPRLAQMYNSTGSKIQNCTFTGFTASDSINNSIITMQACNSCIIYNNTLQDMQGNFENTCAIWNFGGTGSRIYNNTITNCYSGICQKVGPIINASYYRNFFNGITGMAFLLNEQNEGGTGVQIYQNIISGAATTNVGALRVYWSTQTQTNYQIYNNVFYNIPYIAIDLQQGARTNSVYNNIIHTAGTFVKYLSGDPKPSESDYNNFYNASSPVWNYASSNYASLATYQAAASLDANSVTTDPGFVNAGGTYALATDFKRASYTANGKSGGVMGAYQTGNECIGQGCSTVPTVSGCTLSGASMQ